LDGLDEDQEDDGLEEDEDEDDGGEDVDKVGMVPMADMLNARWGEENVRPFMLLLSPSCQQTFATRVIASLCSYTYFVSLK
jgi:hypothetical protein